MYIRGQKKVFNSFKKTLDSQKKLNFLVNKMGAISQIHFTLLYFIHILYRKNVGFLGFFSLKVKQMCRKISLPPWANLIIFWSNILESINGFRQRKYKICLNMSSKLRYVYKCSMYEDLQLLHIVPGICKYVGSAILNWLSLS